MPKRKSAISYRDLDFLLFEGEMHRLLDLLKAPPGNYVGKRLRDYVEAQGIDTDSKAEPKSETDKPKGVWSSPPETAAERAHRVLANWYAGIKSTLLMEDYGKLKEVVTYALESFPPIRLEMDSTEPKEGGAL